MKMYQVCDPADCENSPITDVEIGNQKLNFCCQKGFEKSLSDFTKSVVQEPLKVSES